jgi:hypothetical protein
VELSVASSKEEAKARVLGEAAVMMLFSDGSLIDGMVGAVGVLCVNGRVKQVKGLRLGTAKRFGVYKAEGIREVLAMECLRLEEEERIERVIPLGLNNTSPITATASAKPGVGCYIWDLFHRRLRKAKETHHGFELRVDWTPGHVNIPGNEAADEAAKRAAKQGSFGGTLQFLLRLLYSKSVRVLTHLRLLQPMAVKQFKSSPRYAHIKDVDDMAPSPKFRKLTASLPRKHASLLFQLRSHHALLAKHLHRLKKSPTTICPCCGEAEETVDHFLRFCAAHNHARRRLHAVSPLAQFSKHLLTDPDLLPDLFGYIQAVIYRARGKG